MPKRLQYIEADSDCLLHRRESKPSTGRKVIESVLEVVLAQHAYAKRTWWCLSALAQQLEPPDFRVRLNIHRDDPFFELNRKLIQTFSPLLELQVVDWDSDSFFRRGHTRSVDLEECTAEWQLFLDPDGVCSPPFLAELMNQPLDPMKLSVAPRTTMTDFDIGYRLVDAEQYESTPIANAAEKCAAVDCLSRHRRGGAGYFHLVHPATVRSLGHSYGTGRRDRPYNHPQGASTRSDKVLRKALGVQQHLNLPSFYHLQHWRRWQPGCPDRVRTICH